MKIIMDISSRKYAIIEQIMTFNEKSIEKLEKLVGEIKVVQEEKILLDNIEASLLESEEEIRKGLVMDSKELKRRLNKKMGL